MTSVISDFILLISGSVALSILAKATFILLLGVAIGAIAVRAQASWRHLVFATTFAAVLALPVAVIAIPELVVEFAATPQQEIQKETATPIVSPPNVSAPAIASSSERGTPTAEAWAMPSVMTVVLSVWLAGVVFLLLSLTVDLLRVRHLRRHGLPSEKLRETIERLTVDARMKPVDVMLHEKIAAPVTFGFIQPVIMLPTDAEDWQPTDVRRALVHELEHIRRGDWATQLVARVACAFYWFHPLIWMAWRKLCLEAERSCDDAVVETAGNTEYAEQLVSLARQLTASPSQPVLGMAKRSDLTMRISSLLDTSRGRGRATAAATMLAAFIASLVVISIGPLRAVAQKVQKNEPVAVKENPNEKVVWKVDDDDDDDDDRKNPLDWGLFKAAERNMIDRAAKLVEEGANVNAIFSGDGTALIAASREGHLEMVRFLLDRGAKPNIGVSGDGNALTNAAREGRQAVVLLLLDRGADINAGVEGDGNALIMASGAGYGEIVTLLLDRGADIHKVVAGDENPIIKACETGQLDVVKLLVSKGADVNSSVRVERGMGSKMVEEYRTPLSMARKNGHTAVIEYLLSAGAKQ
jgi:beta-lactamase regulating signal transducer with metallopeptidase domain/ankyrin repeat protein